MRGKYGRRTYPGKSDPISAPGRNNARNIRIDKHRGNLPKKNLERSIVATVYPLSAFEILRRRPEVFERPLKIIIIISAQRKLPQLWNHRLGNKVPARIGPQRFRFDLRRSSRIDFSSRRCTALDCTVTNAYRFRNIEGSTIAAAGRTKGIGSFEIRT